MEVDHFGRCSVMWELATLLALPDGTSLYCHTICDKGGVEAFTDKKKQTLIKAQVDLNHYCAQAVGCLVYKDT